MTTSGKKKKPKLDSLANLLLSKPTRTASKTITGYMPSSKQNINYNQQPQNNTIQRSKPKREDGQALPHELLDNNQGKFATEAAAAPVDVSESNSGSNMDISTDDSRDMAESDRQRSEQITGDNRGDNHILLRPPIIEATGKIATGATTPMLRKQNKIHRNKRLLEQPVASQWHLHAEDTLLPQEYWDQRTKTSALREMAPQGLALKHEAANIIREWEHFGCPTAAGWDWTLAEIQAAIDLGPHKLALKPDAIKHFAEEVADKVAKGQARVVFWDDIKANHPQHLKVGRDFTQVQGIPLNPRPILCTTARRQWRSQIGQRNNDKTCPTGRNRPIRAFVETNHSCFCRSRRRPSHPYGKMGYTGWFLASQLPKRGRVEFLLCMAAGTRRARAASHTKLTPNGLGGVSAIFLRSIRNGPGCCGGLH